MRRREFITLVGCAAATPPLAARAQQSASRIPVVGVLWHAGNADEEDIFLNVLRKAFNDLGYIEGKNIVLKHRFPGENPERFRVLAQELVDSKVDALIAVTTLGAIALKKLTSTIPIVFVLVGDPIGAGLVENLARPGGNATGLSIMQVDLSGKCLGLLKEAVPNLTHVGLLFDPADPFGPRSLVAYQAAAAALGLSVSPAYLTGAADIDPTFAKMTEENADGIIFGSGSVLSNLRAQLGASVLAHRLPTLSYVAEEVPYGLLLSYGQNLPDYFRRAVSYLDRILKGARPADLPVEQPTKLELVLNRKTAKTLGLTFPQTLVVSADEVIE
jgi:putative tryptophan/tyrosine transport system substrate-binding protein